MKSVLEWGDVEHVAAGRRPIAPKHSHPLDIHKLYNMLRLIIIAAAMACCSSFLTPTVMLQPSHRVGSNRAGLHMSSSSSSPIEASSASPELTSRTASESPFSGQMDRRTLLKAVPAAFTAGVVGAAVIAAPETASARATPKAAPAGSKVVVLGGNGFVGSKVCEMLVEAGEAEGSYSGGRGLALRTRRSLGYPMESRVVVYIYTSQLLTQYLPGTVVDYNSARYWINMTADTGSSRAARTTAVASRGNARIKATAVDACTGTVLFGKRRRT